ncbi:alpha/beta fold hydrolase [Granulosicoccaceae sp. 1_MG-2023]|nr:alpha/beta fold hydrolase [Granulosicoccaceae sp. 1_MG-2023]
MPESARALLRGWQAASAHLITNPPAPGRASARRCIAEYGASRLWYYPPPTSPARREPLLLVYAMVNRPTVLDLLPGRSFIGALRAQDRAVYLLEWGDPDQAGYNRGLSHLLGRRMQALVQAALRHSGRATITMAGICQGGVLSLLYALRFPAQIKALILLGTPVDFQTPGSLLYQRVREVDTRLLDDAWCLDGALLVQLFHSLQPMRNSLAKYLQLAEDCADGEAVAEKVRLFQAMQAWIADCPDQPARVFHEFILNFYQRNVLCRQGLVLDGELLKPQQLAVPVLNIYGTRDHIVPADSSRALASLVPKQCYAELAVESGHIGMFVSRRALQSVPEKIQVWLDQLS